MTVASIREALQAGRLMEAVDAARDAIATAPEDFEAAYLKALALSRLGAADAAATLLAQMLDRSDVPDALRAEALALDGRLAKGRLANLPPEARHAPALQASRRYEEAFDLVPNAFAAINAASLHRIAGDAANSARLAKEAARLALSGATDHWRAATLGEAALLQGDIAQARERYAEARALARQRHGDVASMRRQLRLLAPSLPEARSLLREIPAPTVVAFTGHMIDAAERAVARFPAGLEARVAEAIERWLDAAGPVVGYSQAACGSDILFLEALQRRGLESNVVLPCARDDYVQQSVAFAGPAWVERFERAVAGAATVSYATAEAYLGDDVLFEHASRLIDGQAVLRARQLEADAMMLAVLDAASAAGVGGTFGTMRGWTDKGRRAHVIDLAALRGGTVAAVAPTAAKPAVPRASRLGRVIVWIVFADVRGFSTLPEQHSPRFAERFLGEAREALRACGDEVHTTQTAGDGVYATFGSARAAATFAIDLRDRVKRVDWTQFGMSRDTTVRVAAHCGPAYPIMCPVTDRPNYCGTHIIRTARVEPVVTPGEVFVTDSMAAYLAVEAADAFECDYLGVLPLAKGSGSSALYRLRKINTA